MGKAWFGWRMTAREEGEEEGSSPKAWARGVGGARVAQDQGRASDSGSLPQNTLIQELESSQRQIEEQHHHKVPLLAAWLWTADPCSDPALSGQRKHELPAYQERKASTEGYCALSWEPEPWPLERLALPGGAAAFDCCHESSNKAPQAGSRVLPHTLVLPCPVEHRLPPLGSASTRPRPQLCSWQALLLLPTLLFSVPLSGPPV